MNTYATGSLGQGWDYNCNRHLTFGSAGIGYCRGDGISIPILYNSYNYWHDLTAQTGVTQQYPYYTSTWIPSNDTFTIADPHGNSELYALQGYYGILQKITDRNGNELDYTYNFSAGTGYFGPVQEIEDPVSQRFLKFTYDSNGNLSSLSDNAGRTWKYTYQTGPYGGFYLTQVQGPPVPGFPEGTSESYTYSAAGNLKTIKDGNGNLIVSNTYENDGQPNETDRVTKQTLNGATTNIVYTDTYTGTVESTEVSLTTPNGYTTDYYNDGNGNITQTVVHLAGLHPGASGLLTTNYYYGGNGDSGTGVPASSGANGSKPTPNNCLLIKKVDPNGTTTAYTYDQYGDVLTTTVTPSEGSSSTMGTQATTLVTTYTYEPRNNLIASKTDPNQGGCVTTYNYGTASSNPGDNVLSITYPTTAAGTETESFTYNSQGQVLTDTVPNPTNTGTTVTQYTYDSTTGDNACELVTSMVKDYGSGTLNSQTQYGYDAYGNCNSVTDPNSHTVNTTFDADGNIIEIDGASGEVEKRTYDGDDNLLTDTKTAPTGPPQQTVLVYNSYEQLTKKQVYTGASAYLETDYTYDNDGNQNSVTDPAGHETQTAYDERDKPYLFTDATGAWKRLDFDGDGNTVALTDELNHVTTYAYDGFNCLEKKTFPDSTYQTWTYDANGNVTSMLTPAGNTFTQSFDNRNHKLTQTYPLASGTSSTITNTYDIVGRLSTATEGGTSLTYVYDNLGRDTSFTDQAGRTSTYGYDLAGNRTSSTYPNTMVVNRAFDSSNRLSTLKNRSNATQATFAYNILDQPTGITLANGTSVSYSYDLLDRLTNVNNSLAGSVARNFTYVYNNAGLRSSEGDPRGTISYGYTNRNELNSITEPTGSPFGSQTFAYDAGYNRSSWQVGTATATTYAVNNLNEYTTVSGSTAPTWTADGEVMVFGGNHYTYDSLMRLTKVTNTIGIYLFAYDPLGRRVKKVDENPSGTVLATYSYHYEDSQVVVEYQPSTTWTYYLGIGIDQDVMRVYGTTTQWYYHDALGSVSAVADSSGNVLEKYEYNGQGQFQITNASGTVLTTTGIANELMFTGREYDAETGNYFYRARYYNPTLGRFISRDPLSGAEFSQGTNLYAYCENNFLNGSDPTGMCQQKQQDLHDAAVKHFEDQGWPSWMAEGMADAGMWASDHMAALQTANNVLMAVQMLDGAGEAEAAVEEGAEGVEALEGAETSATTPTGQSGSPMDVTPGTNAPGTVNGTDYSGHAFDEMQSDGLTPSVVENTISEGTASAGNTPGTTAYYDSVNNVTAVTNASGRVVTAYRGGN